MLTVATFFFSNNHFHCAWTTQLCCSSKLEKNCSEKEVGTEFELKRCRAAEVF